jgi:hypothetical protein
VRGYISTELIAPFANGSSAICIAVDRSANPDHSCYYQDEIDTRSLAKSPLGALGALKGLTSRQVEQFYPNWRERHSMQPGTLHKQITNFATASAAASVAVLLFPTLFPYQIARAVDMATRTVLFEVPIRDAYGARLNPQGTTCLFTLATGFSGYRVGDGPALLFEASLEEDTFESHQAAWCAGAWCILTREQRSWFVTVLDEQSGAVLDKIRLRGRPLRISAAHTAPILACGLSSSRVQVISLDSRETHVIRHDESTDRYNAMDVAVSPDGRAIAARGWQDQTLWWASTDDDTLRQVTPLPSVRVQLDAERHAEALERALPGYGLPADDDTFIMYTPAFTLLQDRCLTISVGELHSHSPPTNA